MAAHDTEDASIRDSKLRRAVEAMREGILVQSATGEITDCNPAVERLLGVEAGQLLGRELGDLGCTFVRGDGSPLAVADFPSAEVLRTGALVAVAEVGICRVDRSTLWLWVEATPLRATPTGLPDGVVTAFCDVSARRRAEQDLIDKRRATERLEHAQRLAQVGSWETDLTKLQSDWSEETYRILGVPRGLEACYPRFLAAVHPDDRARVDVHRSESLRTGAGYELDHRVVWPDGTTRHVRSRVSIVVDVRGESRRVEGTIQDVTALVQARNRLQNILDGISIFVGLFDLEGRLLEVNRPPLDVAGLTRDQVIGQPIWDTYWWSYSLDISARMRGAVAEAASGVVARLELVARVGDGRFITVDLAFAPLRDADGQVEAVVGSGVDITERLAAERAVRESETRFHAAFHENPIAMGIRRLRDDAALEVNTGFEKLFGVKREDVLGRPVGEFDFYLAPEERRPILEKAERREPIQNMEVRVADRHALMTVAPMLVQGEDCSLASFIDITERKRAEAALLEREAHLDAVFTHTSDAMMLLAVGADGVLRVIAANPAFVGRLRHFVEVGESDVIGLTFEQIGLEIYKRPPQDFALYRAAVHRVVETRQPFGFEGAMPFPDRMLFVDVTLVPILDHAGDCVQVLWSSRDVTARKQADAEVRKALAEKETLLREVHHRVKNNLQVISSLLHFQSKKLTSPTEQTTLRELRQRIFAMTLVHERLYRSRDVARVDFADYVRSLVREIGLSIGLRDAVKLQVEVEPVLLPIELALPSGMLVSELVTNVLKYAFPGERGGVSTVRVRELGTSIEICVEDDGVGFPVGFDFAVGGGFGWELIRALVLQLDARIVAKSGEPGAHVCVTFATSPGKEIAA